MVVRWKHCENKRGALVAKTDDFVNLHNHSDVGSALDGVGKVNEYVERAVDLGQKSIAFTDHGTLIGSYMLQKAATDAGINPIWGLESYMAPIPENGDKEARLLHESIFYGSNVSDRDKMEGGDVSGKGAFLHLTILAKNPEGVHNLIKINSESWLTGRYRKARADQSLLEKHSKGLIFLSGCPSSEINTRLRIGDIEGAERYLDWAIQTFGRENCFLEVMDHGFPAGNEIERASKSGLLYLHNRFRIPFVATNDAHYARPDQKMIHEHMLCVQTGSTMNMPKHSDNGEKTRFFFDGEGYYLRSGEEMRRAIPSEFVNAIENTTLVAEMCSDSRITPVSGKDLWIDMSPHMPEEYARDKTAYMLREAKNGLRKIRKENGEEYTDADDKRLEYEMSIIGPKGYDDYFAFVTDFTKYMKDTYKIFFNPGRGCLVTGTPVWTDERGWVGIEDVRTGEHVRSHVGKRQEVTNTFTYEVSEECAVLTNDDGEEIVLTKDHKVYVSKDGSEWGWVPAGSVCVGDFVLEYNVDQPILRWWSRTHRVAATSTRKIDGHVHDLEVNDDHSFLTKFGVVHNSAGGSLVSYALGITLLDPLRFDLLFERFLNPERESPPDIDFDCPDSHSDALFSYVHNKYGNNKVVHIGTLGKEKAKNSLKDSARILDFPFDVGEKLTKLVGDAKKLDDVGDDLDAMAKELGAEEVVETARGIEGITRQTGIHACGIIASSVPIEEMAPLMVATRKKTENGKKVSEDVVVSQWEYPTLEELGFVKFDFLSLANLTVINQTIESVKRNHGIDIDANKLVQGPMDDPKTYALLRKGLTMGVFQLEGGGITDLMKMMNADSIDDIAAVLALYRPGPMGMGSHIAYARRKNGKEEPKPIHPEVAEALDPILKKTYNVCCYQEQLMKMAQVLAGYSLAEADILRRAVGKKKKYILDAQETGFKERMMANGYSEEAFKSVWDVIVPFSDYGFNASHAYGYALTTYVTAYLKANFTPEFMAALVSVFSSKGNRDKVRDALRECSSLNIPVKPPYVNSARIETTSDGHEIYLGFGSVAGCGDAAAETLISNRPYSDMNDLTSKVGSAQTSITEPCLLSLINAGSFDELSSNRAALVLASSDLMERMKMIHKSFSSETLFGSIGDVIPPVVISDKVKEFPRLDLLRREKTALGLYVSGHPLDNVREYMSQLGATPISELQNHLWSNVEICGIVSEIVTKVSKKGNKYTRMSIEDGDGETVDAMLFGDNQDVVSGITSDDIVRIGAKVRAGRDGDDTVSLSINSVTKIPVDDDGNVVIAVSISEKKWSALGADDESRAKALLGKESGGTQSMRFDICDMGVIRDKGLQIPSGSRSHDTWMEILRASSRSVNVKCDQRSGAPVVMEKLGRIAFETWERRLEESEQRWSKA